ncbi:MAG: hypothetical protein JWR69_4284 [Pedosphaera sp.]|nr:hypothetical protein [Pedosphaera sp.]
MRSKIHSLIGLGLIWAGSAQSATVLFDFNSDPTAGGLATLYGFGAGWLPYGGTGYATNANDGYLQITPASNSQVGAIVFSDFDNGSIVGGFHLEADVRIGNGSTTPADGFCIAFARANDPALTDPGNSVNYASGGGNAQGPEEGTTTGIAVGFDVYSNGGGDTAGIDLRVDGALTFFPMPTLNGSVTDTTSIQTGPNDGTRSPDSLGWAHLIVDLSTSGSLNVYYKGKQMLTNHATGYIPGPGRLMVAGRTGGFNENQNIDNIAITTQTINASVGLVTGLADGCSFTINDSGPSVVNTSTISLQINGGASLTPTSVQKNGSVTTVVYHGYPTLLTIGSTNQLTVSFKDTTGATLSGTRSFVTPAYKVLPAADVVTSGVNTTAPGFRVLPWQSGLEPNRVYWANEQLAGLHGANNADLTTATDGGYIDFTGGINFNITGVYSGGNDGGSFTTANANPDQPFPGIPGGNGLTGNSALEALAFVRFQSAGVYQMGVNSDDGFAVTEGPNPKDRLALSLGQYDGGRGASDSIFSFVVPVAGIYPIRLLWYNGNGEAGNGSSVEWFTVRADGTKVLLNDPSGTNATGVTAFYAGPALPPYVSQVIPYPGATAARADLVQLQLIDGGTQVNPASVKLRVNGSLTTPTVSKSGNTTTVALALGVNQMMAPGSNTATLVWSDNATLTRSNSWSFVVEPYVTLDAGLRSPAGSVDLTKPGFVLKVTQVDANTVGDAGDATANQLDSHNALLADLYFPWYGNNVADTVNGSTSGMPAVTNNIWYWPNAVDFNMVTSTGDFTYDYAMPGIPGVTGQPNSYAAGFQSYVVFPTAGFYQMGVSSDDGFRVTEGLGVSRQALHVTGPGIDTDVAAVATYVGNAGYGAPLPLTSVSGPAVFVPVPCPNLPGVVNLTNKIGVADYSSCPSGFSVHDLAYNLQTNGALAAIIINRPDLGLPFVGDGSGAAVTIPVLVVNGDFGQRDFWVTNSGLVASIGADAHPKLGEADYGKGMGSVDFGFVVPAAGAYPLRLLYFQGGGGAGLEWTTVLPGATADGTRVLVNDSATAGSLLAYRAVTGLPHLNAPVSANGSLTLTWTGAAILQKATQLSPSNWSDVNPQPGGSSYSVPATGVGSFYRLRLPTVPTP